MSLLYIVAVAMLFAALTPLCMERVMRRLPMPRWLKHALRIAVCIAAAWLVMAVATACIHAAARAGAVAGFAAGVVFMASLNIIGMLFRPVIEAIIACVDRAVAKTRLSRRKRIALATLLASSIIVAMTLLLIHTAWIATG